jgi:hypothetical protein
VVKFIVVSASRIGCIGLTVLTGVAPARNGDSPSPIRDARRGGIKRDRADAVVRSALLENARAPNLCRRIQHSPARSARKVQTF